MPLQSRMLAVEVQLSPESVDVQMFPLRTTAASLVPSLEEAMLYQLCVLGTLILWIQLAPESVDVQMSPSVTTAASLVPSLEEAMPVQSRMIALEVQLAPESMDVQMFPL